MVNNNFKKSARVFALVLRVFVFVAATFAFAKGISVYASTTSPALHSTVSQTSLRAEGEQSLEKLLQSRIAQYQNFLQELPSTTLGAADQASLTTGVQNSIAHMEAILNASSTASIRTSTSTPAVGLTRADYLLQTKIPLIVAALHMRNPQVRISSSTTTTATTTAYTSASFSKKISKNSSVKPLLNAQTIFTPSAAELSTLDALIMATSTKNVFTFQKDVVAEIQQEASSSRAEAGYKKRS